MKISGEVTPFCELDAVRLFCRMLNDLEIEPFLEKVAEDVLYTSCWVLVDLNTRNEVATLLRSKIEHIRRASPRMHEALIGVSTCGWEYGKPIVIISKPGTRTHEATVDFEIRDGLISAIAYVSPGLQKAALLKDPDSYVYDGVANAQPESAPLAPPKPEPPDPDPAVLSLAQS
jgi:hypothetical protein